ncbi:P-loop containing nucleoside triphosphate hydrolase protein [Gonapodya prolifera JEL478]|uniref:p-loop containing nucleoside triphosphate hydrolase protein n=1 Tax=Gonapodya prolifera (strain JEL478) TaxID=1344416 RepID=A0A139AI26_GONPJ|nr:P-loop containing nucleoside triphosphate hydrolase protein [Gonapodya prolifera JEL478]|eukprot:KXS16482.1 P-loop containing nucleoside triphosphate hydrolase protein [Gonapodya prolifera JEL478]
MSSSSPHPRTIRAVSPPFPSLNHVRHIVLVLSGKGGVGKSSVTAQLALALSQKHGKKVAALDIDLTGPSLPRVLGMAGKSVRQSRAGWVPPYADEEGKNVAVMSMQFLLPNEDDPVVWRGPKKNAMIKQFLQDVVWGPLDYLLIDTPPGTSDEHISIVEYLLRPTQTALAKAEEGDTAGLPTAPSRGPVVTSVLVTTPQQVAVADVKKEVKFARTVGVPVCGVVENMSGFVCPCCGDVTPLFSSGGGQSLATEYDLAFLGSVPVDPTLVRSMETLGGSTGAPAAEGEGESEAKGEGGFVARFKTSNLYEAFGGIAEKVMEAVGDVPTSDATA